MMIINITILSAIAVRLMLASRYLLFLYRYDDISHHEKIAKQYTFASVIYNEVAWLGMLITVLVILNSNMLPVGYDYLTSYFKDSNIRDFFYLSVISMVLIFSYSLYQLMKVIVIDRVFKVSAMSLRKHLIATAIQFFKWMLASLVMVGLCVYLIDSGEHWWVFLWLFMSLILCVYQIIVSSWIPNGFIYEKYWEDVSEKMKSLLNSFHFTANNVLIVSSKAGSKKANASVLGFWVYKKIIVGDHLVKVLNGDEVGAVLSHEIGHYAHKHILKWIMLEVVILFAYVWLASLYIDQRSADSPVIVISECMFLIPVMYFFAKPILNSIGRYFEYQADSFSQQYGYSIALISALKKIHVHNLALPSGDSWYVAWYFSHPALIERINSLEIN